MKHLREEGKVFFHSSHMLITEFQLQTTHLSSMLDLSTVPNYHFKPKSNQLLENSSGYSIEIKVI